MYKFERCIFGGLIIINLFLFSCERAPSKLLGINESAGANEKIICAPNSSLHALEGLWVNERFLEKLTASRSWSEASGAKVDGVSEILIKDGVMYFSWGWHEGSNSNETKNTCLKIDGKKIWFTQDHGTIYEGPLVNIGGGIPEEQLYLSQFWSGCYESDQSEKWCFSKDGISINGQYQSAHLRMDLSETPAYGTIFDIDGQDLPFLIFLPQIDGGWQVYKDNWASSDSYVPVKVGVDSPWRTLFKVE